MTRKRLRWSLFTLFVGALGAAFLLTRVKKPLLPREVGREVLPVASTTDDPRDASIVLHPAPLPKPCRQTRNTVTFCASESPLTMTRERYRHLRDLWGDRRSGTPRLLALKRLSRHEFRLQFAFGGGDRPLVWFDPNEREISLHLWPVVPFVSRSKSETDDEPGYGFGRGDSLRIPFPVDAVGARRQWKLEWSDNLLSVVFEAPRNPLHVLLDAGHGGTDVGALADAVQEKALNLEAAENLRSALLARGVKVSLTRDGDTWPSLADRFEKISSGQYDLSLSLHHDRHGSHPEGKRPGCFYARADLFSLASALCKELDATPARWYFVVNLPFQVPSILLELRDFADEAQARLVSDAAARKRWYQQWASKTADIVVTTFRAKP